MTPFHLRIQTNSPGELTSWVTPLVAQFKKNCPDSTVTIHLVPCQYKSGQEKEIAQNIRGVDHVTSPKETIKKIFNFKKDLKETGAILFLGGDPIYTRLLSKKFHIPAYAYTEHAYPIGRHFKHVFRKHIDGDLMAVRPLQFSASKADILKKYHLEDKPYLLIFTGSRPQHFEHLTPLIAQTLDHLHKTRPDIATLIQISPFITQELLQKVQKNTPIPSAKWLRGDSLDLLSISKLLLTIPGTNNAEAMYMKCPMLIVIPMHHPKHLILDGLPGLIGNIPLIGPPIKVWAVTKYVKTHPLLSLPNRYLKKKVVPELIGKWTPIELATAVTTLWDSKEHLNDQITHYSEINLDKEAEILKKIVITILSKSAT